MDVSARAEHVEPRAPIVFVMRFSSLYRAGFRLGLILSLAWAAQAGAVPSVDLFFVGLNGAPIADATSLAVAPGDLLDVEMRMATDERGTLGYSISGGGREA